MNKGWIIGLGGGTLLAALLSGLAVDAPFRLHMGILTLVLGLATLTALRLPDRASVAAGEANYIDGPVRIGSLLTVFWGVVGFLVGVLVAVIPAGWIAGRRRTIEEDWERRHGRW